VAPDFECARNFAVRYLGYAPRTRKQLGDRLAAKEFSPEAIAAVMHLLTEKGYIDDMAFAKNYISHKTRINNYGKRRIVAGLMQRGVAKEDIQAAYSSILEQDDDNSEETRAAKRALAKRLGSKNISEIRDDPKEMQRVTAFLMRRGFSYDIVKKVLNQIKCI
jgi:regulatory protein